MKQVIEKKAKVALCRVCKGTGRIRNSQGHECLCRQCDGSGRVTVSMRAEYEIEPYRVKN